MEKLYDAVVDLLLRAETFNDNDVEEITQKIRGLTTEYSKRRILERVRKFSPVVWDMDELIIVNSNITNIGAYYIHLRYTYHKNLFQRRQYIYVICGEHARDSFHEIIKMDHG